VKKLTYYVIESFHSTLGLIFQMQYSTGTFLMQGILWEESNIDSPVEVLFFVYIAFPLLMSWILNFKMIIILLRYLIWLNNTRENLLFVIFSS